MKTIRLLLVCLLSTLFCNAQFGMPSFREVVTEFFTKYSFDSHDRYVKFQRKQEGWFVSQDLYANPGNYFNDQLFWSVETKSYKEIGYPAATGDTATVSENVGRYLKMLDLDYEQYQFQRNKYYGYPGWAWDIIREDTVETGLTDSVLESNARAYSSYASGFITEQFGDFFLNDDSDRVELKATDRISSSRINKFIYYDLKAIDAYSEILNINPDYQTKVGNIEIKRANEYLFMYLELLMAGDTTKARFFANEAEYPDSLLALGKFYLRSLPLNSILITGGDNDSYPLWYLQEVQKYRTDVLVLNYSLLGFRRYLSFIEKTCRPFIFSTRAAMYLKDNFDYFLFSNPKNENLRMDAGNFLKDLAKGHNPYDAEMVPYKTEVLKKYYAKQLYFMKEKNKRSSILTLNNYLYLHEYILLDIIHTSRNRKIFFTFPNAFVSPLLQKKGNLYAVAL